MRGLTTMVPGLDVYRDRLPESFVDGGYYTKTVENRPLIGPTPVPGVSLVTGLSGFGVMVSSGAADLLARHLTGAELPEYSSAFLLSRYEEPGYVQTLDGGGTGQL
jgi:glycine/D-amino acid oxidase-like deaminating enzyme